MNQIGRRFALSAESGSGVSCGEDGAFVGAVPLLERIFSPGLSTQNPWRPRPVSDLNRELSNCYGLPIEFSLKIDGLAGIAKALNRGDVVHAQLRTLHLQIPDPPAITKSVLTPDSVLDLARQLRSGGMLKDDWNPARHPRWPAGSPDGIGGEFAPAGATAGNSEVGEQNIGGNSDDKPSASVIPAEITIPVPFDVPSGIPFPSEIVPPPITVPDTYPRELRNPYPDRPECRDEWAAAIRTCRKMIEDGRFGRDDHRGMGEFFYQCVMGHVSADCGGNPTA